MYYQSLLKEIQCFQVSGLKGQSVPAQGKPALDGCRPGVQCNIDPPLKGSNISQKQLTIFHIITPYK